MIKLTKKLEYALIALSHIHNNNKIITSKNIAEIYAIPREVLAKTLQTMARLNYIDVVYGPKGGYRSCRNLNDISLNQFIEDIQGPINLIDCNTSNECNQINNCNIRLPLNKINDNIKSIFNKISLNDITQ